MRTVHFAAALQQDATEQFVAWQRTHELDERALVLNVRSATRCMLHRVHCSHIREWKGYETARKEKVCSTSGWEPLAEWAGENHATVEDCSSCKPLRTLIPHSQDPRMTVKAILARLESLGDAARRAHNTRAGAPANQFGVKLGDLRAVAKELGTDHDLALALWDTGNVEAQLLATLLVEPASLSAAELDAMTRSTTCAQVADWWNAYVVARRPDQDALREKWMKAKDRWAARAGWSLTASRVRKDASGLDLPALLDRIEKEMPKARPEVQWTMNTTLGTIGIEHPAHRRRAIAIGETIGLYRDWPVSKGCTPPYVPVWVDAMVKRKA